MEEKDKNPPVKEEKPENKEIPFVPMWEYCPGCADKFCADCHEMGTWGGQRSG